MKGLNRPRIAQLTVCILFAITSGSALAQAAPVSCNAPGGGSTKAGADAVACGYLDVVTARTARLSGDSNSVTGAYTSAFGDNNTVTGVRSTASGNYNNVKRRGDGFRQRQHGRRPEEAWLPATTTMSAAPAPRWPS